MINLGKALKVAAVRCSWCNVVVSLKKDYCILEFIAMENGKNLCCNCEWEQTTNYGGF